MGLTLGDLLTKAKMVIAFGDKRYVKHPTLIVDNL